MSVGNSLAAAAPKKQRFSVAIQSDGYKKMINETLGDPKVSQRFIATVTSAVSVNPMLQECDASTILSSALLGESLKLSPSPQLGQYYMVPFNDKKNNRKVATFQLGYKGMIQLAIRSGYYKKINVLELKEGELISFDRMTEDIEVNLIEDDEIRDKMPTIGYYAMFEYLNGFRKAMYWTQSKMERHADQFSMAFSLDAFRKIEEGKISQADMWKYSSFWYKNFEDMAKKTMLRQLISKWGIMSIELQQAYERDETFAEDNSGKYEYVNTIEADGEEIETTPVAATPTKTKRSKEPEPLANPFEQIDAEEIPFSDEAPEFVIDVEGQEQ